MGGFVDGVIPYYSAVLEIKTKSTKLVTEMKEPIFIEWGLQASSYVSALNKQFDWNLDKVIMLYLSRDNPRIWKAFEKDVIFTSLDDQINAKKLGDKLIASNICPNRICKSMSQGKDEYYCGLAPICFGPNYPPSKNAP
jgi:hypothetical protein